MRPVTQFVLGFAVCFAALGAAIVACGGSSTPALPALWRCQLDTLKVLPPDVGMVTVYDAIDIWERTHRCAEQHAAVLPDGGAP